MWVWYGRPEGLLARANLCAFRYFSELLIRAARRRSVLKDRYLQTAFLRLDTKALHRAPQIQKLYRLSAWTRQAVREPSALA